MYLAYDYLINYYRLSYDFTKVSLALNLIGM